MTPRPRRRRARLLPLALLAALPELLLGCKERPRAEPPRPASPATLVVATRVDISGFNELIAASTRQFDQDVWSGLFLRLVEEQPDFQRHPPTFAPQLARSWERSPDGTTLTFHLRDDVRWSDGVPVTAADVRFTWQAQRSPEVGWPSASYKEPIRDVEVVDAHTVRFHFHRAYPKQLLDANEGFILPAHAWSKLPFARWPESADWFRDHLVVDGPFRVEEWKPRESLTLRANERYYRTGRPRLARIVFRIVPDEAARLQELLSGKAGFLEALQPDRAAEVERAPGRRLLSVWPRRYAAIIWNTRRRPFDDAVVRRAITLAIDRERLSEAIWGGRARVADSPIPSTVWAHAADLHPWPYDPAQAKRLLADRGFRDSDGDGLLDRDRKPLSFELSTNVEDPTRRDAVVLVQEQLRRVGIAVRPAVREAGAQVAKLQGHDFDAAVFVFGIDTGLDLRYGFDSRDPNGTNFGGYRNPGVDRLLDEIDRVPELLAAKPLLERLQRILHEEQPFTFLWEPPLLIGLDARLRATPSPLSTYQGLEDWELATAPAGPGRP